MPRSLLLFGFWLAFSHLLTFGAPRPDYPALTAKGRQLAAEKSWALARDAYAAAQGVANNEAERRWCAVWLADATWRASDPGEGNYSARAGWRKLHLGALDALLAPYKEGVVRDDLWVATMESRAELEDHSYYADGGWKDRAEIAEHLAAATPIPENAARHFQFLRAMPAFGSFLSDVLRDRLLAQLRLAARVAPAPDQRAWAGYTWAILSCGERRVSAEEGLRRWAEARAVTKGTGWENLASAEEFVFRVRRAVPMSRRTSRPCCRSWRSAGRHCARCRRPCTRRARESRSTSSSTGGPTLPCCLTRPRRSGRTSRSRIGLPPPASPW